MFTGNAFNIIEKQTNKDVLIPDGFHQTSTITVHDNIATLGIRNAHNVFIMDNRVNGILIQHGQFNEIEHTERDFETKQKRSRRSFILPERSDAVQFNFRNL